MQLDTWKIMAELPAGLLLPNHELSSAQPSRTTSASMTSKWQPRQPIIITDFKIAASHPDYRRRDWRRHLPWALAGHRARAALGGRVAVRPNSVEVVMMQRFNGFKTAGWEDPPHRGSGRGSLSRGPPYRPRVGTMTPDAASCTEAHKADSALFLAEGPPRRQPARL